MDRPDILLDHEQRISTLEGITSEIRDRLNNMEASTNSRFNSIENRLNTQTQLILGLYGTIIIIGAGIIAAILTQ